MRSLPLLTLGLVAAGTLGLGAALIPSALAAADLTTVVPDPVAMQALLTEKKFALEKALAKALETTGGVATAATLNVAAGTVEVTTYSNGKLHKLVVDATGESVRSQTEHAATKLEGEPVTGLWTETASGLKYFELKAGTGEKPLPTAKVRVHYTGWTLDGKKFDSSVDRGQPAEFPLNGVIAGWTEGVGGMQVGGKRKLVIPHGLAYGDAGRPPVIPPKATLVFDVELIEILK